MIFILWQKRILFVVYSFFVIMYTGMQSRTAPMRATEVLYISFILCIVLINEKQVSFVLD